MVEKIFTNADTLSIVLALSIPMLRCPSDAGPEFYYYNAATRYAKTNYVANFGVGYIRSHPDPTCSFVASSGTCGENNRRPGPFYWNTTTRIADMTDGTSHTLLMSELLRGENGPPLDWRGLNVVQGCQYTHLHNPNSSAPDTVRNGTCQVAPIAPCENGDWSSWPSNSFNLNLSARSSHPGGVNGLMGDGSVRFYDDEIDYDAWQALGTHAWGGSIEAI